MSDETCENDTFIERRLVLSHRGAVYSTESFEIVCVYVVQCVTRTTATDQTYQTTPNY